MDITVTDAVLIAVPNSPNIWVIAKTVTDGNKTFRMAQVIPEDMMEWRAAEYDIDPNDRDTLMDIILYQHHLDDGIDDNSHPQSLMWASTVEEARDFHLNRIKTKKANGKTQTRKRDKTKEDKVANPRNPKHLLRDTSDETATPLDIIKAAMPIDPEILEVKKQFVRELRKAVRLRGNPTQQDLMARPNAEELRVRFFGRKEHRQ